MKIETSVVYEMPADQYNKKLADALKKIPELQPPEWSYFVKTGVSRERPPQEPDFWYKRAASILRQIYIHKVVGVNRLRTRYGGKQDRGMKPKKFRKASVKIIRTILQQSEKTGLLEKTKEGKRHGRKLTQKGISFLEEVQ